MRLSLHEVLAIVGRLDDHGGSDTPRERFRRFLVEHMTSASVARTFLDEAQQLISEQYQRALQDTVLATGRLLGFEAVFGGYDHRGQGARTAGQWLSRRRLAVTVQVWSDDASSDPAAIDRSLELPLLGDTAAPQSRLAVIGSACGSRFRIEEAVGTHRHSSRVVSVRSLADLISLVNANHLTHDDVLRLLRPSPALEGSIGVLARLAHARAGTTSGTVRTAVDPGLRGPTCWVYVAADRGLASRERPGMSDKLVITLPASDSPLLGSNDLLAFMVPSRGVVAQGQVEDVSVDDQSGVDESRVRWIVRLRHVVIMHPPTPVDIEQRLNLELLAAISHEPCVRVTRQEFEVLTLPYLDDQFVSEVDERTVEQ